MSLWLPRVHFPFFKTKPARRCNNNTPGNIEFWVGLCVCVCVCVSHNSNSSQFHSYDLIMEPTIFAPQPQSSQQHGGGYDENNAKNATTAAKSVKVCSLCCSLLKYKPFELLVTNTYCMLCDRLEYLVQRYPLRSLVRVPHR
jgi:hypothetical protein